MTVVIIVLAVLISLAALICILSAILAQKLIYDNFTRAADSEKDLKNSLKFLSESNVATSVPDIERGIEWIRNAPQEEIEITSRDGLRLRARLIPAEGDRAPQRAAVLVHGYRSTPEFDFSSIAKTYHDMGFLLLIPYQRTHGRSEGEWITFGSRERYDIVDWCKYLEARYPNLPFLLSGISMGTTTVLLAAAEPDMPAMLRCITADCGFVSPRAIFEDVLKKRFHLPPFPLMNIASAVCQRTAGFSFDEFTTVDAVKKLTVPILFLHGEADDFVSPRNTAANFEACASKEKKLITVPGAGHGVSYLLEPEKCQKAIFELFDKAF